MRALPSLSLSVLAVLAVVPGWTGDVRLDLPGRARPTVIVRPVPLDERDPRRRRLGGLFFLGGVQLSAGNRAFGGYSALAVQGDRFTLLSDGGVLLRFRMGADWHVRGAETMPLPAGPGTGWKKSDRDAESLALDPSGDTAWVGFERSNAVWRYRIAADGAWQPERGRDPATMANWPENGGAESMARLADGRFVLLSEGERPPGGRPGRVGLVFAGEPTAQGAKVFRFTYLPEPGFVPADAVALPDGRLLVLERAFRFPNTWRNRLAVVPAGAIRPGALARGRTLARLERPLLSDNFEGVAVTREGAATTLWLVSDDNQAAWQRTLLLKFRLDG